MTTQKRVSIIIPTTHERKRFNDRILNIAISQDYVNKEILFDYNPGNIGEKRNRLCERATGEIIIHFDSDDLFKSDWITKSVEGLIESKSDITGLSEVNFYDEENHQGWKYDYYQFKTPHPASNGMAVGGTLCYWKKFWETKKFRDIQLCEDQLFVTAFGKERFTLCTHDYVDGFLGSIHSGNTSLKLINNNLIYKRMAAEEEERVRKSFFVAEGSLTI